MSTVFDAFKMSPVFLERNHALKVSTVLQKLRARIIHLEQKLLCRKSNAYMIPKTSFVDNTDGYASSD
jgi:hypothetical protein